MIKKETQNYGNKFDSAVDDAMAKAKAQGQTASAELQKKYEEAKSEASAKLHELEGKGEAKIEEAKKQSRGWFGGK